MNILITGAAGLIGAPLVKRLIEEGHNVILVDNFNDEYDPRLKRARVQHVIGDHYIHEIDIQDFQALKKIFAENKLEAVIHLAAKTGVPQSVREPLAYHKNNVEATWYLLELARIHGVGHFIFASSSSVYGNTTRVPTPEDETTDRTLSPYAASKKAGEIIAHSYHMAFGLPTTILRFFNVYGPWAKPNGAIYKFISGAHSGRPLTLFGDGKMLRDFTYVDDIVDGLVRVIKNNHPSYRIYNLGSSSPISVSELVDVIERKIGKPIIREFAPKPASDILISHADVSRARQDLGWSTQTTAEEGIAKTVDWYLEHKDKGYLP